MAASLLTSTTTSLILPTPFPSPSSPFPDRSHLNPLLVPSRPSHRPFLRGSSCLVRFGFKPGLFPDPDVPHYLSAVKHLLDRAEGLVYTVADAAVSSPDSVTASTSAATKQEGDWLSGITYTMETVLKVLKDGLSTLHVPYAYGFAIILLTVIVKAVTFPLTKKQVESAMAMRSLQPQVKAIQQRYAGNQEKIQLETARLYKLAGINPLAGCLPTLATIPVWIGLYRALSNVANEGLLTEGFFWIPSLAGPTTLADRQSGSGISWLFPFVDGHPPLGWSDTLAYLVLPVLLIVSQYISVQILQSAQSNDPNMKSSQAINQFLPLMIGYFALSVPSGLSLYWFTNNVLSSAQQVWLQKLGGAKNPLKQFDDDMFNEDQVQSSKSDSQAIYTKPDADEVQQSAQSSYTKPKADQLEGSPSGGLRPGERFKQIKEEEARRRRQREEEKMKPEQNEANGSGRQIESGGLGEKATSQDGGNGYVTSDATVMVDESATTTSDSSTTNIKITDVSAADSEHSSIDKQESHVQREQEEVNGSVTRTDDKVSEEDRVEVKRE